MSLVKFDFSRTGKKHVVNKDLLLEEVDDNIAGVAHKPSTIAKVENLFYDTENIVNSNIWSKNDERFTITEESSIDLPISGVKVYKVTRNNDKTLFIKHKDIFLYPEVNYALSIYIKPTTSSFTGLISEWAFPNTIYDHTFSYTIENNSISVNNSNDSIAHKFDELENGWYRITVVYNISRDKFKEALDEDWVETFYNFRLIPFYFTLEDNGTYHYISAPQLYTVTDEEVVNQTFVKDYVPSSSIINYINTEGEQSVFRGIKIQNSATNLLTNSSDFSQNWVTEDSNFQVTNDISVLDPKGGTNSYKLESTIDGSVKTYIKRNITETSISFNKVFSIFAKAGNTNHIVLNYTQGSSNNSISTEVMFDLSTGAYITSKKQNKRNEIDAKSEYVGNGWDRLSLSAKIISTTTYGTDSNLYVNVVENTSKEFSEQINSPYLYVFGAQVENINLDIYPEPSDYIETQASPLSVSEEIISLSNASNYINVSEQTIFLKFEIPKQYGASTLFSLSNSLTVSPSLEIIFTTNEYGQNKIKFRNFIENSEAKEIFIPESGDTVSLAFSYDPNSITIYTNRTEALNESSNSYFIYSGIFDKIEIGRFFSNNASNAYIKSFAIFRRKLSDDNLRNVTTGDPLKELKPFTLTYLFGLFPTAKYAGYSLKHINPIYLGPIVKVRRSSDNATLDVYQDNGWVDMLDIEQFSSFTDNVYVETWYDQSGNGNHITNADTTKQPMIYQGGVGLIKINENPACYFDGVNDSLNATFSTPIGADKELCTFILAKPSSVSDSTIAGFKDSDPGARAGSHRNIVINSGDIQIQTDVSEYTGSNNAQVDVPFLFSSFMLDGVTEVFTNGIFHGQTFNTNMSAVDQFSLGKDAGTESGFFNGYVQEVILYEDDIYADRIGIENHINDYYNAFLSFDKFISSLVIDDEEYGPLSRSINIAREFNKGLVTTFSQARPFNMYAYEFS